MDERLRKQMEFILEVDKIKNIGRQTYLSDGKRKENDAEHSWHLALMAMLLKEHAAQEIDVLKAMTMVLIHDIVEIDAGDTYAYDEEAKKSQKEREEAAKEKIFSMLPDDQKRDFIHILDEFEAMETPEAKFARALDNVQPLLLNDSNGGKDWIKHQVSADKVYARQQKTKAGSEILYDVADQIIQENIQKGNLK